MSRWPLPAGHRSDGDLEKAWELAYRSAEIAEKTARVRARRLDVRGADFKRQATKWRCPTGDCEPKSLWRKASRLHPLIPRESRKWGDLYRGRSAGEREFGRLKNEYGLAPFRVRGLARVQLHADLASSDASHRRSPERG